MKKMRLDDMFPTPYVCFILKCGLEKKHENTLAASRHARTIFETALKPR